MKKYGKKTSKLLQIRLSNNEYNEVIGYIKNIGKTRREWLLNKIRNDKTRI